MRRNIVALILGSLLVCDVNAATWYGLVNVSPTNQVVFFDADSLVKQPGSVTIWLKFVNSETAPDPDGSYSTASRAVYSCAKHTVQVLHTVAYDKTRQVLRSFDTPTKVSEIVPGSVGEGVLSAVCTPVFPDPKSASYVRLGDNDVYATAKRVLNPVPDSAPQ